LTKRIRAKRLDRRRNQSSLVKRRPWSNTPSLLVFSRLGASVLALVGSPIVARALGPSGRGQTAATLAICLIVPVLLSFGIPLEVRRVAAVTDSTSILRTCRIICLASVVPSTALAFVLRASVFSSFSSQARAAAVLCVALTPLTMSWMCDVSVLVAHRRFGSVFLIQIVQPAAYLLIILAIWILGHATVTTVLLANAASSVVAFTSGVLLTGFSNLGSRYPALRLLRNGSRFAGSSISEVASRKLDQVLVLPLLGGFEAGIYSVAATVASIPLAVGHALAASYFTPIARSSGDARRRLKGQAARAGVALGILTFPPLALVSWFGIPIIFGSDFSPAVTVTMVSLAGSVAMVAAYVYSMALAAEGKGTRMTVAQIVALAFAVCLLYLLGPALGASGAALASSLSYAVLLALLHSGLDIPLKDALPRSNDFKDSISRLFKVDIEMRAVSPEPVTADSPQTY
jgi:O-antigen/teichoic acid export membrane protein